MSTRYEPGKIKVPQGQAPGSAAEVIRRARGQNPLVRALMQPQQRQAAPRGGQARPQVKVNVDTGAKKRREQALSDAKDLQLHGQKIGLENRENERAYQRELTEQNRVAEGVRQESAHMIKSLGYVMDEKIRSQNAHVVQAMEHQNQLIAGSPTHLAAADQMGLSPMQALERIRKELRTNQVLFSDDMVAQQDDFFHAVREWEGQKLKPSTMSMEPGEEEHPADRPQLPSRANDYAYNDFTEKLQGAVMIMDQSGALERRDMNEVMLQLTVSGQKVRERGVQEFESVLRANNHHDAVVRRPHIEKGLNALADQVSLSIAEGVPLDTAAVNKLLAASNRIPEAQELMESLYSGQTPAINDEASAASVAAITYGNQEVLAEMLSDLENPEVTQKMTKRLSYYMTGEDTDKKRIKGGLDKMREILYAAQTSAMAFEGKALVSEYIDHKKGVRDMLEHHRISMDALMKAAASGAGRSEFREKTLEEIHGTTDAYRRELGLILRTQPYWKFLSSEWSLSPRATQMIRGRDGRTTTPEAPGPIQQESLGARPPRPTAPDDSDEDAAMRQMFEE